MTLEIDGLSDDFLPDKIDEEEDEEEVVLMTGWLLLALDETLARRGGEKPEPGEPLLHPLLLLTSPGDEDDTGKHLSRIGEERPYQCHINAS